MNGHPPHRIRDDWRRLQMRVCRVARITLTEPQARKLSRVVSNGGRLSFWIRVVRG